MAGIVAHDVDSLLEIFEKESEVESEIQETECIAPPVPTLTSFHSLFVVDDSLAVTTDTMVANDSVKSVPCLGTVPVFEVDSASDVNSPTNVSCPVSATESDKLLTVGSSKALSSREGSTDHLEWCEDEASVNSKVSFDQEWNEDQNCRNGFALPVSEAYGTTKQCKAATAGGTGRKRTRYDDDVLECEGLTFDKVPSYYTALSIPARIRAGSAAQSSSDLIADFMQHERDPSPERKTCSVYDKLPAYHSSFANSTRYDDQDLSAQSTLDAFFFQDESELENRYGRSADEAYHSPDESALIDEFSVKESCIKDGCVKEDESQTENAQRCTVYVGRIPSSSTSRALRSIFNEFGQIQHCSVHLREHGDNYGFVTYVQHQGACAAVERGNTVRGCEDFDICFGGRRKFCKADYSDLDGNRVIQEELVPFAASRRSRDAADFDDLLHRARQRLTHQ